MLFLKCCPRCRGDIYLDKDTYGHYIECLQCGFSKDLPDRVRQAVAEEPGAPEEAALDPLAVAEERFGRAS